MPKRSSKPSPDPSVAAYDVVARLTGGQPKPPQPKNPAAVALGRLGGLKGGRARADKLSKARRSQIAKEAAKARWGKERGPAG